MGSATADALAPALAETFIIIALGYILARTKVLGSATCHHISLFITYIALPALVFQAIATLDLSSLNYNWVLGVSLAKSVLWIAASVVTIIVSRRHKEKVALAGIRAIFCVQSNDLALGVPIVMALYGRTHPEYVGYLFILQPVTLCFLDPMGFLLIECGIQHRHRSKSGKRGGACWAVLRVLKRVVTNPIVMVVFLGLIWNLAVRRPLPGIVALTLKTMGQSFDACALLVLGISMNGLLDKLDRNSIALTVVLLIVKNLVAPILSKFMVTALGVHGELAVFAFIYGALPTAPVVFVWANVYRLQASLLASAVVLCTMLSAPMMLVTAQMDGLNLSDPNVVKNFAAEVWWAASDASIVTIVGAAWVLFFLMLLRHSSVSLNILRLLSVCEIGLASFQLWCTNETSTTFLLVRVGVTYFFIISARFCVASIAMCRVLETAKGRVWVHRFRWWFYLLPLLCGGLATASVEILGAINPGQEMADRCTAGLGESEDITSVVALSLATVVCAMCLVMIGRAAPVVRRKRPKALSDEDLANGIGDDARNGGGGGTIVECAAEDDDDPYEDSPRAKDGRPLSPASSSGAHGQSSFSEYVPATLAHDDDEAESVNSAPTNGHVTVGMGQYNGSVNGDAASSPGSEPLHGKRARVDSDCSSDSNPGAAARSGPASGSSRPLRPSTLDVALPDEDGLADVLAQETRVRSATAVMARRRHASAYFVRKDEKESNGFERTRAQSVETRQPNLTPLRVAGSGMVSTGSSDLSASLLAPLSSERRGHGVGRGAGAAAGGRSNKGWGRGSTSTRSSSSGSRSSGGSSQQAFLAPERPVTAVRFLFLIMYHVASMSIAVLLLVVRVASDDGPSPINLELEFLDTCLNYGQGLILLLVFGLGDDLAAPLYKMVGAVVKFMRRLMFGVEDIPSATAFAPTRASLDGDEAAQDYLAYTRVVAACDRFAPLVTRAAKQICKDRKYRLFTYKQVFIGSDLVDFCLDQPDLPHTRAEAVMLCRQLMVGGVIEHIRREHNFYDGRKYFYRIPERVLEAARAAKVVNDAAARRHSSLTPMSSEASSALIVAAATAQHVATHHSSSASSSSSPTPRRK